MPLRKSSKEKKVFWTLKSKLKSITKDRKMLEKMAECVLKAHEAHKRASFFLVHFCLHRGRVPDLSVSTIRHCLDQVCMRDPRGSRPKGEELGEEMRRFWELRFSSIYPDKVDMRGLSMLKQVVAQQMLENILVDLKTHFESRLVKTVHCLLKMRCEVSGIGKKALWDRSRKITKSVMSRDFQSIPEEIRKRIETCMPKEVEKCTRYDLKSNPGKYVGVLLKLCQLVEDKAGVCFMPTRRSNVPCNVKMDTECVAQMLLRSSECVSARRAAPSREHYNDWVWNKLLQRRVVDGKLKGTGFAFHHEISTDGVSVSILYSKPLSRPGCIASGTKRKRETHEENCVPSARVGLDPGKKNILTMVDEKGIGLRYTSSQRKFESKLSRYKLVLQREKEKNGILAAEAELSLHSHITTDASKYEEYLRVKSVADKRTKHFYREEKWRNWKFRMYCKTKSSESRLFDRMKDTYGAQCTIYYGNWSRCSQMKGCSPSPTKGLREKIAKRFKVITTDEYLTSQMCNMCHEKLLHYRTRSGRLSHSRLYCESEKCTSSTQRRKTFVDRDSNASANILKAGMSSERPAYLSRTLSSDLKLTRPLSPPRKRRRLSQSKSKCGEERGEEMTNGSVAADPPSSDPPQRNNFQRVYCLSLYELW